jgi:Na+/H+ antiporter NhaD/arsenite permease-like protein
MYKIVVKKLIEERLLIALSFGWIVTSLYLKRFPAYSYSDLKVLYSLAVFLMIIEGLKNHRFFSSCSLWFESKRFLGTKFVLLAGILAAFVTNDVALLVIIPFTLALNISNKGLLIILETIAVNIFSCLTPFGNPQNMFIYYHYNLHFIQFIKTIWLLVIFLATPLILFSFFLKINVKLSPHNRIKMGRGAFVYLILFAIFVLAVLGFLPLNIGLIILLGIFIFDRSAIYIDYLLLATFFMFFGFTDNLVKIFHFSLYTPKGVFLSAVVFSQIFSNVPTTLLLADFTPNWKALLWGVSVGGFGMIWSSLAGLIAFRMYKKEKMNVKGFLLKFHLWNFFFLLLGIFIFYLHM